MTPAEYLRRQQRRVEEAIDRLVPPETTPPCSIHAAMRYSLFAGGKRIRPVLCLAAAEAVGHDSEEIAGAASALEMVHTYSLIHDDLPAIDNDDLRRGRPTNHRVYGEAIAILAGDALLTLAFQVLAQLEPVPALRRIAMVAELAVASGTVRGMIAGQVHDIEGEGQSPAPALLDSIHHAKTGALLRASVRLGALHAGASPEQLDALSCFGTHVGLAFQIVDDILDVEQSSEALGKTAGKDVRQQKITFPAVYGIAESRAMAERERLRAHRALDALGPASARLRQIADLVVFRES